MDPKKTSTSSMGGSAMPGSTTVTQDEPVSSVDPMISQSQATPPTVGPASEPSMATKPFEPAVSGLGSEEPTAPEQTSPIGGVSEPEPMSTVMEPVRGVTMSEPPASPMGTNPIGAAQQPVNPMDESVPTQPMEIGGSSMDAAEEPEETGASTTPFGSVQGTKPTE